MSDFAHQFLDPEIAWRFLPAIGRGFLVTLALALPVVVSGIALGLALAVLRCLGLRLLTPLVRLYADLFRMLPPLVTMSILFFALPLVGLSLGGPVSAWLALTLALGAFAEESFWTAILAVPRGQWEAARASDLGFGVTLRDVILPQALRISIPTLTNRTIAISKGTALASVVGVPEMLGEATAATAYSSNTTPLVMAAAAYLALFWLLTAASRRFETRVR